MVYLDSEKFKEKYPDHDKYCWVCKCYMSTPYKLKFVFDELIVTVPVCFEHRNELLKSQIDIIEKRG